MQEAMGRARTPVYRIKKEKIDKGSIERKAGTGAGLWAKRWFQGDRHITTPQSQLQQLNPKLSGGPQAGMQLETGEWRLPTPYATPSTAPPGPSPQRLRGPMG